jgi:hypothetical protein
LYSKYREKKLENLKENILIVRRMIFVLQIQVVKSLMRRIFKRENMQLIKWGVLKNLA